MTNQYKEVSKILNEFGNCSAGIAAYESPARPFKKLASAPKKQIDYTSEIGNAISSKGKK